MKLEKVMNSESLSNQNKVRWFRWFTRLTVSWLSFLLAFLLMVALWGICFGIGAMALRMFFLWGVGIAGAVMLLTLVLNEPIVVLATKARRIKKREQCPELWDAVHKVAPACAKPTPRIYVLPDEGMNAVCFGLGLPFLAAVGATEGILKKLTQAELEAVMAHEIGHVINRDIIISMIMGFATMAMVTTGWLLLRIAPWNSGGSRDSSEKGKGFAAVILAVVIGLVMYLFGRILGVVLQAFVSRQREYAADATSARIVGTSSPLKSALLKIVKDPGLRSENVARFAGFLFTADPDPTDIMATHPPMPERIKALEKLEKPMF